MLKAIALCSYIVCTVTATFYHAYALAFVTLSLFFVFDTLTGIGKGLRLGKLRSKSIWFGIGAKMFMLCIPFLLNLLIQQSQLSQYGDAFLTGVFALLSVAELISSIQNINAIITGVESTEQDVISRILNLMLALLNKVYDKLIGWLDTQVKN